MITSETSVLQKKLNNIQARACWCMTVKLRRGRGKKCMVVKMRGRECMGKETEGREIKVRGAATTANSRPKAREEGQRVEDLRPKVFILDAKGSC